MKTLLRLPPLLLANEASNFAGFAEAIFEQRLPYLAHEADLQWQLYDGVIPVQRQAEEAHQQWWHERCREVLSEIRAEYDGGLTTLLDLSDVTSAEHLKTLCELDQCRAQLKAVKRKNVRLRTALRDAREEAARQTERAEVSKATAENLQAPTRCPKCGNLCLELNCQCGAEVRRLR